MCAETLHKIIDTLSGSLPIIEKLAKIISILPKTVDKLEELLATFTPCNDFPIGDCPDRLCQKVDGTCIARTEAPEEQPETETNAPATCAQGQDNCNCGTTSPIYCGPGFKCNDPAMATGTCSKAVTQASTQSPTGPDPSTPAPEPEPAATEDEEDEVAGPR